MRRLIAVLLVGVLGFPQLVSGQTLAPGTRVRFSHPGEGTRTGTVVALTTDTLEVSLPDRAESAQLPLVELTRLEVSAGKQHHVMTRAGIGFLAGAGIGAVTGFAAGVDDCSQEFICVNRGQGAALGGIFFGAIGGAIGLIAGAIPSEAWVRVPLERRRISLVAPSGGNGRGVGLRIAF